MNLQNLARVKPALHDILLYYLHTCILYIVYTVDGQNIIVDIVNGFHILLNNTNFPEYTFK